MTKMISLEEARELVLSHVTPLEAETVDLLDAAGRVAAADLKSDIDVSPFAHAAMDGYAGTPMRPCGKLRQNRP